jgi:hypothetical protein
MKAAASPKIEGKRGRSSVRKGLEIRDSSKKKAPPSPPQAIEDKGDEDEEDSGYRPWASLSSIVGRRQRRH